MNKINIASIVAALTFSVVASAQDLVPVNLYAANIIYSSDGGIRLGAPRKLTGDRGVSSQPSFTPDGRSILFIGRRDSANAQSDVYRIDLATGVETRITSTPEMENSPTVTPDGKLMVIRWIPATLFKEWGPWIYDMTGKPLAGVLPGPDTVGYYTRIDSKTFAMVRPKTRTAVAIFDMKSKTMTDRDWPVANLPPQLIPGQRAVSYTRTDSLGRNEIRRLDIGAAAATTVAPSLLGRVAHAWTPRGHILMGKGNKVFVRDPRRDNSWREVAAFTDVELQSVTAYVVSPSGDKLIVISPAKPPIHLVIQDSLQDNRSIVNALTGLVNQSPEALKAKYDVSRGALVALLNAQRRRSAEGFAELEAFVVRLTGPLPTPPAT